MYKYKNENIKVFNNLKNTYHWYFETFFLNNQTICVQAISKYFNFRVFKQIISVMIDNFVFINFFNCIYFKLKK